MNWFKIRKSPRLIASIFSFRNLTTNANIKYKPETIELSLPKFSSERDAKGIVDDLWERFPKTIDKITDWFKHYQVDSIELWISGVIETGTIMKLIVSAKGEGGRKVVLKPKAGK